MLFGFALSWGSVAISLIASVFTAISANLGKEFGDKINPYNDWDWFDVIASIEACVWFSTVVLIISLLLL